MRRSTVAETALASRVASFEAATGPSTWSATDEAILVQEKVWAICEAGQTEIDSTQGNEVFSDSPWVPPEMKDVVEVFLGCRN